MVCWAVLKSSLVFQCDLKAVGWQSRKAAWAWIVKYIAGVPGRLHSPDAHDIPKVLSLCSLNRSRLVFLCAHLSSGAHRPIPWTETKHIASLQFILCEPGWNNSTKLFPFPFSEEFTCLETVNTRLCSFHSAEPAAAADDAGDDSHDPVGGGRAAELLGAAHGGQGHCHCHQYPPATRHQPHPAHTSWCQ